MSRNPTRCLLHQHHRTEDTSLRQQLITTLCTLLRVPFALLNLLQRPFVRQQQPRRIVVIKPCCLGDLLMTTPFLEVLQQNYPNASISYVAGTWSKVIPEHSPVVQTVLDCGSVGIPGRYSLKDYMKFALLLRSQRFDMAFVLDRSPMLTLLPWFAGIPRRIGPDSLGRGFSLTDRVPVSTSPARLQHQVELYLDLARALKLSIGQPRMHFQTTTAEQHLAQSMIALNGFNPSGTPLIAVFPGGGSNPGMELTAKRWPLERYRQLVQRLVHERRARVLLLGGPDDIALNDALMSTLNIPAESVFNMAGKTSFGQLAASLEACSLFIGNDSSPMHLAAAVGIPIIAIFGPTSPQEYGPYPLDDPQHIALWHNPNQQPCFFLGKMQPCEHCTCMQAVSIDEVWQAVQQLLARSNSSPGSKEVTP